MIGAKIDKTSPKIKNTFTVAITLFISLLGGSVFVLPHTGYAKRHGLHKVDQHFSDSFAGLGPLLSVLPDGLVKSETYLDCRKYGPNNGRVEYPDKSDARLVCDKSIYRTYSAIDAKTYQGIDKLLAKNGWQLNSTGNSKLVYTRVSKSSLCRLSISDRTATMYIGSVQRCSYYLNTILDW